MKLPWHDKKFVFLFSAVILVVGLEIMSLMGLEIPMPFAPFIYAAFILGVGHGVLWGGLKALVKLNFRSINLLMLIAVVAAFYLKEYPEAAVVIVLYVLGENLEDIGLDQSRSALDNLMSKSPKTAILKNSGEEIPIENVEIGSVVIVKPHNMIPLDGTITLGESSVDESTITGEPIPKDKSIGDTVFAGTLNQSGYIELKTTKTVSDTMLSKIISLTFEAQSSKSESQKFIEKFAKYYTPSVIFLSLSLFLIPVFVLGKDFDYWLNQAITLLVISCPCALVISTPVAIFAAIGNASNKGALIKGGKYLEAIGRIKVLFLDKTRTLTFGRPVVSDVFPLNGNTIESLLACTSGIESFSEHPLAQAITNQTKVQNLKNHSAEKFESIAGKGAKGICLSCENRPVFVGNLSYIKEICSNTQEAEAIVEKLSSEGKTSMIAAYKEELKGVIGLTDEIKSDSKGAIKDLLALGVKPVMLTGDNEKAGWHIGHQLGIDEIYGNLLPEDKVLKVKEFLPKYGSVGMVGDGVNDAPALAQSTVGIAMGATGSDTAIEIANIALMNDKLSLIPFLIRLGRKTIRTIKQNCIGAILIKIIFIFLAFLGHGNLVMAITADVGVTLVVILISLRLMSFK